MVSYSVPVELIDEAADLFGVKVNDYIESQMLFDAYPDRSTFEECIGENWDECEKNGTGGVLSNGEYVFFNECNYDWKNEKVLF